MSETFRVKEKQGDIIITRNAVAKVIIEAVNTFGGKICITNPKGKTLTLISKISGGDEVNFMDINFEETGANIKIYVLVKQGEKVGALTNSLINKIYEMIKRVMGVEPNSIAVAILGTMSKTVARKNIEITKRFNKN